MANISNYIFNIVIIVLFIYEAFILFTKKNGGADNNFEKYTEESLAKFSIFAGVIAIIMALVEVVIVLAGIQVIPIQLTESGKLPFWIGVAPLIVLVVVYLIGMFTMLKKRDDYVDTRKQEKNNDDEDY